MPTREQIQFDFDQIADLEQSEGGRQRYDDFVLAAIPLHATDILDVGCGTGGLARKTATAGRRVIGIDLSPRMIRRAELQAAGRPASFVVGDFLEFEFEPASFDCVISSATLHHMPAGRAIQKMVCLLKPGGRLILHDVRRTTRVAELISAAPALVRETFRRFRATRQFRASRAAREAWRHHGAGERYLSIDEARELAMQFLPGASVYNHPLWRYTIIWTKPNALII